MSQYTDMIEKCIAVCPRNTSEMERFIEDLIDPGKKYLSGV